MAKSRQRTFSNRISRSLLAAALAIAASCCAAQATSGAPAGTTAAAIQSILANSSAPDIDAKSLHVGALRALYARRDFEPAWSGNAAASRDSQIVESAIANAEQDGLDPFDYHAGDALFRTMPVSATELAERDLLLTDGILQYARDLRTGRPRLRALDKDIDLPQQAMDAETMLDTALKSGRISDFLRSLEPPQAEYARLKDALARYRRIAADGGWRKLPPTLSVDLDEASDSGAALHARLAFEDDALDGGTLGDGLKRFQARHGLPDDGRVGPRTLSALNVPAFERALEIMANMERWRWLPRPLEPVRVVVNVPDGQLDAIANGTSILASRVIVGKPRSPTPILRAEAKSVTINPPWNVPAKIAKGEILRKLRRSADYLQSEHMVLVNGPPGDPYGLTINWGAVTSFPYSVRQLPGPGNALGQIKLELPNRFDVYLHDTPAKAAFDLDERNLSHGCVRVQQIAPLASYALSGDANAMIDAIHTAVSSGATQHLALPRRLPVYLLYWTVFPGNDGTLQFRQDIYGRDARMIAAMSAHTGGQRVTQNEVRCDKV